MKLSRLKKIFIGLLLLSCIFMSLFSVSALEVSPLRAEACPNCNGGALIQVTQTERYYYTSPCIHGWPQDSDTLVKEYANTYMKCNRCGWGYLINQVDLAEYYICSH